MSDVAVIRSVTNLGERPCACHRVPALYAPDARAAKPTLHETGIK
jgi:hypothetical protein